MLLNNKKNREIIRAGDSYYVCAFRMDKKTLTTEINVVPTVCELCCTVDSVDDEEFLRSFGAPPTYAVPVRPNQPSTAPLHQRLDWNHMDQAIRLDDCVDVELDLEQSCKNYAELIQRQSDILEKAARKINTLSGQYRKLHRMADKLAQNAQRDKQLDTKAGVK